MELEDPKDLRARFRKFLILTNERKKMSKMTMRKRIAIIAASTLTAGMLSVVATPVANANNPAGTQNAAATNGQLDNSLFVATASNTTGAAVGLATTSSGTGSIGAGNSMRSIGLLAKDTSSGTAQTMVVLPGASIALYAQATTSVAFTTTGGSFNTTRGGTGALTYQYSNDLKTTLIPSILSSATAVATIWTAPSTVGTYTVSLLSGFTANSSGVPGAIVPDLSSTGLPPTLGGQITVSVVSTTAGGTYSAAYSACRVQGTLTGYNALTTTNAAVDSSAIISNGNSHTIDFDLNDAYAADLPSGSVVVTATNGALVNVGTTSGATPVAGTASTVVYAGVPSADVVRIDQPTAGAPLTTTVTITYNGTTVCTKTVSIRGKVAKITVANVGTQSLTGSTGSTQWMYQEVGAGTGLFTVLATDSAGNIVATNGIGTFSADAATLTTTVGAITVDTLATSASSSSTSRFSFGAWTCTGTAGQSNVKIKFTTTATGETVTSDAFTARCADSPYTYTVSLDKAAYNVGDLATATVQFLDSKGNKANSVTAVGANSWTLPFMTGVTFTIADGASATAVTKADGSIQYTFTVGTTTTITPGTYTGVVSYSVPAGGVKATPTYKLSTGGDTTTNADVLKSIVALIASINKQIQALQKLILKR